MTRAADLFAVAQAHHAAGRLAEAAQVCRQAIAADPRHSGSTYLLGTIALVGGQADLGIELLRKTIELDPRMAAAHAELALVLHGRGELDVAVGHYRQAIALNFDRPEIFHNLGVALMTLGKLDAAVTQFTEAVARKPDFAESLFNLGNILRLQDKTAAAVVRFEQVLALQPDHVNALCNLGEALLALGQFDAAADACLEAIAVQPDSAVAHSNLAAVLQRQNRWEEAEDHARQALAFQPNFADAAHNLGLALQAQGRFADAAQQFRHAIALRPTRAAPHVDLGAALFALNELDAAADTLETALMLEPGNILAMNNLAGVVLDQGRPEDAAALYRKVLTIKPNALDALSNLTFAANFIVGYDTAQQQALRRDWNAAVKRQLSAPEPLPPRSRGNKLRIGYVSAHFRHQAAAYALAPGIIHHDPARFEVFCYSDTRGADEVTARLQAAATYWRDTRVLTDAELAAQISTDEVDILVDCTGHMGGARHLVFARKPAPIQITAWGEPTGTGLTEMDYLLADPVLVPAAERSLFAETIADLPCFLGYWTPEDLPAAGPLPAADAGFVTFGSFNRAAKITDTTLALWMQVLAAIPTSRLVLKDKAWTHESNCARLRKRFAAHELDPARVDLIGGTTRAGHFAAYQRIDIALDPLPHGGGMTTLEALWMGLPVVTKTGPTPSSRLASAVLAALDLNAWCAVDDAGYVTSAAALAADLPRLATIRAELRAKIAASRLAPVAYARALEDALLKIAG